MMISDGLYPGDVYVDCADDLYNCIRYRLVIYFRSLGHVCHSEAALCKQRYTSRATVPLSCSTHRASKDTGASCSVVLENSCYSRDSVRPASVASSVGYDYSA